MFYNLHAKEVTLGAQGQTHAARCPVGKTKADPAVVYSLVQTETGALGERFLTPFICTFKYFP